jgi:hypothetical protein
MSTRAKGNIGQSAKRAEAVALDDENWIWAVIFTTTALAALSVATLFTIAVG